MMRFGLPLLVLLAGCNLYFDKHDPPPPVCEGGAGGGVASESLRDPTTGICETFPGSFPCDPTCGLCPDKEPAQPPGNFPECNGPCDNLDEATCLATVDCHASYTYVGDGAGTGPYGSTFAGCWDTDPISAGEAASCAGLDAYSCAKFDNCASVLAAADDGNISSFSSCVDENAANLCVGVDCGTGAHCETQCGGINADGSMTGCSPVCVSNLSCATVDCGPGTICEVTCDANGTCGPTCVPQAGSDPGTCPGSVICSIPPPDCPSGSLPGIANECWTGYCIPSGACNTVMACEGATCTDTPPACPTGTVPGVANGCWNGFCVPLDACPFQACNYITDEKSCLAQTGCKAIYAGTDCTCDANGNCTCQSETFEACE